MSGATIFVVGMLVLLLAYGIALMFLFRDNTVVREPSEFELAARRFSEAMKELQRTFAVALLPAFEEATRAINRFGALLREAASKERAE